MQSNQLTVNNEQLTSKNQLLDRILRFAIDIISLVDKLPRSPAGMNIANQLVRSATSIGANTEEAQGASSRRDFINKMHIALKEAKESNATGAGITGGDHPGGGGFNFCNYFFFKKC